MILSCIEDVLQSCQFMITNFNSTRLVKMQKVRKLSGLFSTHIVRRLINITAEIQPVKGNQLHIATLETTTG